jgi:hypothetical protein
MPVVKAPKSAPSTKENRRALEIISRAGNGGKEPQAEMALTVRVPPLVLEEIDQRVRARRVKIPRHAWLLEAIYAKLDSENGG